MPVDFKKYAEIIELLRLGNKEYWVWKHFDNTITDHIKERFGDDPEAGLRIFSTYQEVLDKLYVLKKQGVSPDSPECFMIAKQWWEMILEFTGGNLELLPELQKFNDKKDDFNNLSKAYGKHQVLENISFTVVKGEIFALLGTNGAGKTTTLECLEGIRRYDTGKILINGKLGVQLQSSSLPADITAKEAIMLFAKWQDLEVTDDYFIYLGIKAFLKKQYHQLSTGQKRRLHLAIALLGHPDIIVLDEPTAGLDVEGRNSIHQEIKRLKTQGKTILLASHDMTEVEELCDRIGVLNHGKIVFIGAPDQLHQTMQSKFKLKVRFSKVPRLNEQFEIVSQEQEYYIFETTNLEITLKAIIQLTEEQSIKIMEINTVQPKLEERFLKEVQS